MLMDAAVPNRLIPMSSFRRIRPDHPPSAADRRMTNRCCDAWSSSDPISSSTNDRCRLPSCVGSRACRCAFRVMCEPVGLLLNRLPEHGVLPRRRHEREGGNRNLAPVVSAPYLRPLRVLAVDSFETARPRMILTNGMNRSAEGLVRLPLCLGQPFPVRVSRQKHPWVRAAIHGHCRLRPRFSP